MVDLVRLLAARERGAPASAEIRLPLNFRMPFLDGHLRMRVAITFCYQTKRERGGNEHGYSLFRRSKTESLREFAEFGTPVLFNHECAEDFASIRGLAQRNPAAAGPRQVILRSPALFAAAGSKQIDNVL